MKISYNFLKSYLPQIPTEEKLADIFTYHLCEVEGIEKKEDDTVFDINILPNRAHDLLSHRGIAKELSSLLNIKYNDPFESFKIPKIKETLNSDSLKIDIQTKNCRRYMGRIVRGIKIGPSPLWMVKYLEAIGQRSINNIVDATNIVLFDVGQPTHCFDLAKIKNNIVVRQAKDQEEMTTLDNKSLKLTEKDMVITNSENILAIAGIKGGKIGEVDKDTKDIVLEVASFEPVSVRKTAQSINIFTDARKRFENDLSPEICDYAMQELSSLILEMCKDALFEEIVDVYPLKQNKKELEFSLKRISNILGLEINENTVEDILNRYNFEYKKEGEKFNISVPYLRLDLLNEEDMAEEIGRIIGYDKVLPKISTIKNKWEPQQNETYSKIYLARNKLLNEGYSEIMSYSFRDKGKVEVMQSASDKKFLRENLSDGLAESIKLNQINAPFLEVDKIKIFEIGTVFQKGKEEIHVAFGDKKEIKEMSLDSFVKDITPYLATKSENNIEGKFKMWSLYPFIMRDIAVWMPENEDPTSISNLLKENGTNILVKDPYIFDSFTKNNRTSYAFRLIFQSYDRTLTDIEVNALMEKITSKIKENPNWELR